MELKELVDRLWKSDEASALTNEAARAINKLNNQLHAQTNKNNRISSVINKIYDLTEEELRS